MATLRSREDAPTTAGAAIAYLRYSALEGQFSFVSAGFTSEQGVVVRNGNLIIVDCLRVREGEVAFSPKFDDSLMVPRCQKLPPRCGKEGYADGMQIDVVSQGFGLAALTTTANCVCQMIENVLNTFSFAPEAQADQLPVYRIDEPRRFQTKHGSTLYAPKLTLVGWTARSGHCRPALQSTPKAMNFELRAIASDAAFDGMAVSGEVVAPETERHAKVATPAIKTSGRREKGSVALPSNGLPQSDPDLDDAIPF